MELIVTLFIFMTIGLLIVLVVFFFLSYKQNAKLAASNAELKHLRDTEKHLREEMRTLQDSLRQSFEDPVTSLLSWKLFEDRLKQNIKESERYQLTLGLLMVDIDDFKVINDALSHETGDVLLKEVAKRLETCIRQVDSLARFSKDTFVILLAQLGKPEMAAIIAQRIYQALNQPFQIANTEIFVSVCIGIATFPTDGQDTSGLLRSADHALHLAKAKGKGVYQFYQEKMYLESQRELALHTSLNRDDIFQELQIYYQPIIKVENESLFCLDALLHWQHAQVGLINTIDLSQMAEKQHKLNQLSEWLLKNACKQFLHWRSVGFAPSHLGIPLSIKQLDSSHFIYRISQILQELKFRPEWLLFEIKDNAALLPYKILRKAFNMLKYIGVKIAIDDFGADSFTLAYLKDLQIDYIKLNHAMIADISSNEATVALIKSIVYLAKNLFIEVIVQGVESEQQVSLLKSLGCSLMQGRLLGTSVSQDKVVEMYE